MAACAGHSEAAIVELVAEPLRWQIGVLPSILRMAQRAGKAIREKSLGFWRFACLH